MLESGIKGTGSVTVVPENTAAACGSGTLQVFATPAMIALMEKTCLNSVAPFLEDGCGTVGTLLNVRHTAPTPLGMEVTCESELTQVDGRRIELKVAAYDQTGKIGEGTHQRFIVTDDRFLAKAARKLEG